MRFGILASAMMAVASPAGAATIVQNVFSGTLHQFAPFDTSLGHLDSARLDYTIDSRRGYFRLSDGLGPVSVDWVVDGLHSVSLRGHPTIYTPLQGSGSVMSNERDWIFFSVQASNGIDLDTDVVSAGTLWFPLTSLLAKVGDTSLSSQPDLQFINEGSCDTGGGGVAFGNDNCLLVRYTITYNYTPVPEPAAWAMMLSGFGLVGFAMRRRNSWRASFA